MSAVVRWTAAEDDELVRYATVAAAVAGFAGRRTPGAVYRRWQTLGLATAHHGPGRGPQTADEQALAQLMAQLRWARQTHPEVVIDVGGLLKALRAMRCRRPAAPQRRPRKEWMHRDA